MTVAELRAQLAARQGQPIYVLAGPDEREKSELATLFGELVEPELRAFNVERYYGGDTPVTADTIVESARTLPMMAPRRVVVLLQAERVLSPKRKGADEEGEDAGASNDVEALVDYVASPSPETTLVLVLGPAEPLAPGRRPHELLPLNGGARITKALAKAAVVVQCGVITDGREATTWLATRSREAGLTVEPAAAQRLVDLANGNLAQFRTSVERVLTFCAGQGSVTEADVDEAVIAHETSTDDWALVRALERGQAGDALRELRNRLDGGDVPFAILGQLAFMVRNPRGRFPGQRVPRAVDALFRTDLAMKSSGGDPRVLLERLIVELCG